MKWLVSSLEVHCFGSTGFHPVFPLQKGCFRWELPASTNALVKVVVGIDHKAIGLIELTTSAYNQWWPKVIWPTIAWYSTTIPFGFGSKIGCPRNLGPYRSTFWTHVGHLHKILILVIASSKSLWAFGGQLLQKIQQFFGSMRLKCIVCGHPPRPLQCWPTSQPTRSKAKSSQKALDLLPMPINQPLPPIPTFFYFRDLRFPFHLYQKRTTQKQPGLSVQPQFILNVHHQRRGGDDRSLIQVRGILRFETLLHGARGAAGGAERRFLGAKPPFWGILSTTVSNSLSMRFLFSFWGHGATEAEVFCVSYGVCAFHCLLAIAQGWAPDCQCVHQSCQLCLHHLHQNGRSESFKSSLGLVDHNYIKHNMI